MTPILLVIWHNLALSAAKWYSDGATLQWWKCNVALSSSFFQWWSTTVSISTDRDHFIMIFSAFPLLAFCHLQSLVGACAPNQQNQKYMRRGFQKCWYFKCNNIYLFLEVLDSQIITILVLIQLDLVALVLVPSASFPSHHWLLASSPGLKNSLNNACLHSSSL